MRFGFLLNEVLTAFVAMSPLTIAMILGRPAIGRIVPQAAVCWWVRLLGRQPPAIYDRGIQALLNEDVSPTTRL